VLLNDRTPPCPGISCTTIPHGHYRDWFAGFAREQRHPDRLVCAGFIRAYKDVPALIRTFGATAPLAGDVRLEVAGAPHDATLAEDVRRAAAGDSRVILSLGFLEDAALVRAVTRAALVVLPYRELHNSGAALMALSLDRPVLVPDNEVTKALATEVGQRWVLRYDGQLTPSRLLEALAEAADIPSGERPDLRLRDWQHAAAAHVLVYRRALDCGTRRGRAPRPYSR
jgi:glycosyltransferase involved in cell wall biosynthesis